MKEGADELGWSFKTIIRNADPEKYTPDSAGHLGFGDQSGAKQSGEKTWLRDAFENGAELLVRTPRAARARRERPRRRRRGRLHRRRGERRSGSVTVRAPTVVVACGSLESPALLLRSGIGGPAAGNYLRLHPCVAIIGSYAEDQRAWWGAPAGRPRRRVRERRGRLRLPDRGRAVRARA